MMNDRERWLRNEKLLLGAAPECGQRFTDIVRGMERLGWKPRVMEVRRSKLRQVWLVARGASRTLRSKHLTGRAMDVIPAAYSWKDTPVEFMADLWVYAQRDDLTTGILFGLTDIEKRVWEAATYPQVYKLRRGWDPCHVEVRDGTE